MPGLVTALRCSKAPSPQTLTILQKLRSKTGDTPGVQLQGKEANAGGLKRPGRGPGAIWCLDPFGQPHPPPCTAAQPAPCSPLREGLRARPLSTGGGAESRERRTVPQGAPLPAPAPPPSRLPQPRSTQGEGRRVEGPGMGRGEPALPRGRRG